MTTGQLDAFKLFKVLRSLHERKADGILTLRQNDIQKEVRFAYGWPVAVQSNVPAEALGPALVRDGLISSTEFRDVSEESVRGGASFVSLVVEKDLVARQRLKRLETKLSKRRILDPFGWPDGEFTFENISLSEDGLIEPINPLHIIIDSCLEVVPTPVCVRFVNNYAKKTMAPTPWLLENQAYFETVFPEPNILEAVERGLKFEDVKNLPGDRPTNIRQAAALILSGMCRPANAMAQAVPAASTEQATAPETSDADATTPFHKAPTPTPAPPESVEAPATPSPRAQTRGYGRPNVRSDNVVRPPNVRSRTIITAPPAGRPVVEEAKPVQPGRRAAKVDAAARARAVRPVRPANRNSTGGVPQKRRPAERPNPKGIKDRTSDSGRAIREEAITGEVHIPKNMGEKDTGFLREALALAKDLDNFTHYELLSVEATASVKLIRHEFRKLARKFHVDRFSRYDLNAPTVSAIQAVFIALNRAHETLSDVNERQEYDISLEFVRSAEKRTGTKANPVDKNARLQDALQAEKLVQVALAQLSRGEAAAALQRLQKALTITPDDPSAVAGLVYAQYLVAQSQGSAKAVASRSQVRLRAIIKEVPKLAEPHLYLGRILRDRGEFDDAVASFKEALRINPHLSQATSELRYAAKRKQDASQGFKGLFGRKK